MIDIGKRLTGEQFGVIQKLRDSGKTILEVAEMLEIAPSTVTKYSRISKYQYEYQVTDLWNEEDTEYIIAYYPYNTLKELAYALDKTQNQVTSKVGSLINGGYLKRKKQQAQYYWTPETEQYIVDNYGKQTNKEIGAHLNVEPRAVTAKIKHLRVKGFDLPIHKIHKAPPANWTDKEVAFLKAHYHDYTRRQMMKILGKSNIQIQSKVRTLVQNKELLPKEKGRYNRKSAKKEVTNGLL